MTKNWALHWCYPRVLVIDFYGNFSKIFSRNTDFRDICIYFGTSFFAYSLELGFLVYIWFPLLVFQKNIAIDFVSPGVLTKPPIETSTMKPKNCSFTKNEFHCEHLPEDFSRLSECFDVASILRIQENWGAKRKM